MSTMPKILPIHLLEKKKNGQRFSMLTAYDALTASLLDQAGIECILVGDSLGNVILGHASTLPVTMADMVHHTKAVRRGCSQALLVADMPFLSYQVSLEQAKYNAGRLMQEAGAEAVKLEVGPADVDTVRAIVHMGIPVIAHLGFTPQSVYQQGGYRVQARTKDDQDKVLDLAKAVEQSGACAVLLEMVPIQCAKVVTEALSIPTIGIGAGPYCDGQVLVTQDVLGMTGKKTAKFVRQYAKIHEDMLDALSRFKQDVETGQYPDSDHSYA